VLWVCGSEGCKKRGTYSREDPEILFPPDS
jgi:hypothetical protein